MIISCSSRCIIWGVIDISCSSQCIIWGVTDIITLRQT
jgi:hypothetical protein